MSEIRKTSGSSFREAGSTIITEGNTMFIKGDILTKQAIDEVRDNIQHFKNDINLSVSQLRDGQERIDLGDVKSNIKVLENALEKDLNETRKQNDKALIKIKDIFNNFKEKVFESISKLIKRNEKKVSELYHKIKAYEENVNKQFTIIEDKQEQYLNLVKLILETTKDQQTQLLVQQFLVNDQTVFDQNKKKYIEEFSSKQDKLYKEKIEREKKQVKQILDEEIQKLEKEVDRSEELELQKKHYDILYNYNELQTKAQERENERMNKLNQIEQLLYEKKKEMEDKKNKKYSRYRKKYSEDEDEDENEENEKHEKSNK